MAGRTRLTPEVAGKTATREILGNARGTEMSKVIEKAAEKVMDKASEKEIVVNGRRTEMNNVMEMVDSCIKTQKDFMDSLAKAQKEGVERWVEATVKLQEPLLNAGGAQKGPMKDVLGFYNTCLTTMMNSVKTAADESGKIQESWRSVSEKQMEMAREMMQNMTGFFQPVGAQK